MTGIASPSSDPTSMMTYPDRRSGSNSVQYSHTTRMGTSTKVKPPASGFPTLAWRASLVTCNVMSRIESTDVMLNARLGFTCCSPLVTNSHHTISHGFAEIHSSSQLSKPGVPGRTMARIGLRMMPPFPWSPLKFRKAGFPRYGFKADVSDGALPSSASSSRRAFASALRAPRCL